MSMISGKIIKGSQLGSKLGFPTINIPYFGLERGVYVGRAVVAGKSYAAAVNVGSRPTVDSKDALCEMFLLKFDEDLEVGTEVEVELLQKIRDIKKFPDLESLKNQISKDVEFVKSCYNPGDLN